MARRARRVRVIFGGAEKIGLLIHKRLYVLPLFSEPLAETVNITAGKYGMHLFCIYLKNVEIYFR